MKKTKRVGTISMALILISFGILILIAQVNGLSATKLAMKFWPSILILLGGEILWYSFKSEKDENIMIRYDIFSIFIVMVIVGINIIVYGIVETGAMDLIKLKVSQEQYSYDLPFSDYMVDDEIKKIIINGSNHIKLTVRTNKGSKITSTGRINTMAESEKQGEELLEQEYVNINKSGDTIYLSFKEDFGYKTNIEEFQIIIPEDKLIEVEDGGNMKLILENLNNNIVLNDLNILEMRVNKDLNLKLKTTMDNRGRIRGNAKWNIKEIQEDDSFRYDGELIYGEGKNIINVLNCNEIVVDEI